MTELEKILSAKKVMEASKRLFLNRVSAYISANVDHTDIESIEDAIFELPECEAKLCLYDMVYDLQNK